MREPVCRALVVLFLVVVTTFGGVAEAQQGPVASAEVGMAMPASGQAQTPHKPGPLAHTFSIVARDPQTGEIGAAVQSHWFAVGQSVIWSEAGVGAVATQSFIDPSYGKLGLDLMRAGKSAPEALRGLLRADAHNEVRQVAMIDVNGKNAVFTGCKDIDAAGHVSGDIAAGKRVTELVSSGDGSCRSRLDVGENFSVEANLMSNSNVWPAMERAFAAAKGDLAERMLAALDAAQAVGGDIRGRQSAALIVVKAQSSGTPWQDRIFDVRVDDAAEPLKELRRLVLLQRAYNHMNAGDLATEKKDNEGALREYAAAEEIAAKAEGVHPSRLAEMMYWHAVALVNMGRVDDSLPLFKKVFAIAPTWASLTPRLPNSSLLPADPKVIDRILLQASEK